MNRTYDPHPFENREVASALFRLIIYKSNNRSLDGFRRQCMFIMCKSKDLLYKNSLIKTHRVIFCSVDSILFYLIQLQVLAE